MREQEQARTWSQQMTAYLMKGPRQALSVALVAAVLPFFSWVAIVIVALVTLRKGAYQGLNILLWAMLPLLVIGVYQELPLGFVLSSLVLSFGLPWLMSWVLRATGEWRWVTNVCLPLTVLVLGILALAYPNYQEANRQLVMDAYHVYSQQALTALPAEQIKVYIDAFSQCLPGVQAMVILLSALINVLVARFLQASLYRPGGLRKELLVFKPSAYYLMFALLSALAAYLGYSLGYALVFVFAIAPMLSGLSLMHWLLDKKLENKSSRLFVLVPFYILLVLFMPFSLIPLLGLSAMDSCFNFRKLLLRETLSSSN